MRSVIDLIIRIKNGYLAKKVQVEIPGSKVAKAVLEKLIALGYIESYEVEGTEKKPCFVVTLKYENGNPSMMDVKIVSKPGQKQYVDGSSIPSVLNGLGESIMSTNKGIVSGKEAKKMGVGGELLFTIW